MAEEFPAESQDVLHIEVFSPGAGHALCTESQGTAAHTTVAWRAFWGGQWLLEKSRRKDAPRVRGVPKVPKRAARLARRTHQHRERAAEPQGSVQVAFPGPELWETSDLAHRKSWDTRGL